MKLLHFPDKPFEQDPKFLEEWDKSRKFICEQKIDGWRMVIIITEYGMEFVSRHNKNHTADIEPEVKKAALELRDHFPVQTQIDSEWLSRRARSPGRELKPRLFLLDVIRHGPQWLLSKTYSERHKLLEVAIPNISDRDRIDLPPTAEAGAFTSFYEEQKTIVFSEGVVVKRKDSKLIGSRTDCAKNPQWFKVKYRSGLDGHMPTKYIQKK